MIQQIHAMLEKAIKLSGVDGVITFSYRIQPAPHANNPDRIKGTIFSYYNKAAKEAPFYINPHDDISIARNIVAEAMRVTLHMYNQSSGRRPIPIKINLD